MVILCYLIIYNNNHQIIMIMIYLHNIFNSHHLNIKENIIKCHKISYKTKSINKNILQLLNNHLKSNKLIMMWTYNNFNNISHNNKIKSHNNKIKSHNHKVISHNHKVMMAITSHNSIKWKTNRWMHQWCPINSIKNKKNIKKNNINNKLLKSNNSTKKKLTKF